MESLNKILKVISDYLDNQVRSEDEIRSKLIVPLTEALGYESKYRGEAFPVYSHHGHKKKPTTEADFILFDDPSFNSHSKNSEEDRNWVYDHSLLVIEAKKPEEFPEVQGQAQFYTMWTRALAYIVTDGIRLKAWLFKESCSDELIVDCDIRSGSDYSQLLRFDFTSLSTSKEESRNYERYSIITDPSEINLPAEQYNYMRSALGKNADGLDNLELISMYLKSCDFILQNKLRYNIPPQAIDLLRAVYEARVYINNDIAPIDKGDLYYSYWDDFDDYQFSCRNIRIDLRYYKKKLLNFGFLYESTTNSVSYRIGEIEIILKFLKSERFTILFEDEDNKTIKLLVPHRVAECWNNTKDCISYYSIWLEKLEQLSEIEKKYGIEFYYDQKMNSPDLFVAIDSIYNGIKMKENFILPINTKDKKSFEFDCPTLLLDGDVPNISDINLLGYVFHPARSYALPGKYKVSVFKKTVDLSICCEYALIGEV